MLYHITFYYTISVIVIVSDLKVPSLQILHTNSHYRVSLCGSETISFFSKLPAVDAWSVAMRRREWQTTPTHHCWTLRRSVCPTGSTQPVWGCLYMQRMMAVRRRCWQQPPANDMWQQLTKAVRTIGLHDRSVINYILLKMDVPLYFRQ